MQKYIPTPLDLTSFTTCSIFSSRALDASLNRRCASSKKNTILGLSQSPTSGRFSNSSESSQSRKVEYSPPVLTSEELSRMFIMPLPSSAVLSQSLISRAGVPKKTSPPSASIADTALTIAATEAGEILP